MISSFYVPTNPNDTSTPAMVIFEGTQPKLYPGQILEDVFQVLGKGQSFFSKMYGSNACPMAQRFGVGLAQTSWAKEHKIIVGGNSLGGEATAVSSITGISAYVTNAATVSEFTYMYPHNMGNIQSYYVNGEFLHEVQKKIGDSTILSRVFPDKAPGSHGDPSKGLYVHLIDPVDSDLKPSLIPDSVRLHYAEVAERALEHDLNEKLKHYEVSK